VIIELTALGLGGVVIGGVYTYFKSKSEKSPPPPPPLTGSGVPVVSADDMAKVLGIKSSQDIENLKEQFQQSLDDQGIVERIEDPPSFVPIPISHIASNRKIEDFSYLKTRDYPELTVKFLPSDFIPTGGYFNSYYATKKFHHYKDRKPVKCRGSECQICAWAKTFAECGQYSTYVRVRPAERYYYNVLVRDFKDESYSGRVKVIAVGKEIHQKIEEHRKENCGRIIKDLRIRREMRQIGNQEIPCYGKSEFTQYFPIANLQKNVNSILAQRYDLSQIEKDQSTDEEIEEMLELLRDEFAPKEDV
jgi:hypothetical protein